MSAPNLASLFTNAGVNGGGPKLHSRLYVGLNFFVGHKWPVGRTSSTFGLIKQNIRVTMHFLIYTRKTKVCVVFLSVTFSPCSNFLTNSTVPELFVLNTHFTREKGVEMPSYLPPKPNALVLTPHLAWGLMLTKIFRKKLVSSWWYYQNDVTSIFSKILSF